MKCKKKRSFGLFAEPYAGPRLLLIFGPHAWQIAAADSIDDVDAAFAAVLAAMRKEKL